MNKTIKVLSVLVIAIMLISVANVVFATAEIKPGDVDSKIDYGTSEDQTKVKELAGKILGWVRNIAAVASVVLVAILGLKFMIGSTEERAEYKKSFMPLIIGAIIVLSASTIAGWIWSIG